MTIEEILMIIGSVILFSLIFTIIIKLNKVKVTNWVKKNLTDYEILKINWTLFGPSTPGKGQLQYVIVYKNQSGQKKKIFAISSLAAPIYTTKEFPY